MKKHKYTKKQFRLLARLIKEEYEALLEETRLPVPRMPHTRVPVPVPSTNIDPSPKKTKVARHQGDDPGASKGLMDIEGDLEEGLVFKNQAVEDVKRCNNILKKYNYKIIILRGHQIGEIPELGIERLDFT